MDFEYSPDFSQVEVDAAAPALRENDSIVPALRLPALGLVADGRSL